MTGIEPALSSPPVRRPAIGLHPERSFLDVIDRLPFRRVICRGARTCAPLLEERARAPLDSLIVTQVVRDRVSVSGRAGARAHGSRGAIFIEEIALDTPPPLRARHCRAARGTPLPRRGSRGDPRRRHWSHCTGFNAGLRRAHRSRCADLRGDAQGAMAHTCDAVADSCDCCGSCAASEPKTPKAAWVSRGGLRSFRLEKTREVPPTSYPPDPGPGASRAQGKGRRPDKFLTPSSSTHTPARPPWR